MFMPDRHAIENIKRYPDIAEQYVRAEMKIAHTWKNGRGLQELFNECLDIDDISEDLILKEENHQMTFEDLLTTPDGRNESK